MTIEASRVAWYVANVSPIATRGEKWGIRSVDSAAGTMAKNTDNIENARGSNRLKMKCVS